MSRGFRQVIAVVRAGFFRRNSLVGVAFGNAVRTAAQLAANQAGVGVIRLSVNGFDTHLNQPALHARLLGELAAGIAALKSALVEIDRWNSTLVMTYAEFGRRAQENNSNGTCRGGGAIRWWSC